MSVRLLWARGGEARIVSLTGDAIELLSSVPWPPGSRAEGELGGEGLAIGDGRPRVLRLKVHGSRRRPEGDFLVAGRPIDLPRDLRERLEALLENAPG